MRPGANEILLAVLLCFAAGCRTVPLQPAMDFSGPGWVVRQGQVVWKQRPNAAGVAGELLVATHPDGQSVLQFTKTPLPFLVAQQTTNQWQVQFVPRNKSYSGRGEPPARLIWLHLPAALERRQDDAQFNYGSKPDGAFMFWNVVTEESLEGFLGVTARPSSYVVKSGDYMWRIAARHGVSLKALREANPEVNWTRLRIGQRLVLPPP